MLTSTRTFLNPDGSELRRESYTIPTGKHKDRRTWQRDKADVIGTSFKRTATGGTFTRKWEDGTTSIEVVEIDR
jgi:hypothetical protein